MFWRLHEGLQSRSTVVQAWYCVVSSQAYCEPSEFSANPLTLPSACPGGLATSCATSHGAGSSACLGSLAERQQPVRHASSDPPRPQQAPVSASGSGCSRAETPRAPSSLVSSAASAAGSAQASADADYIAQENVPRYGPPRTAHSTAEAVAAVLKEHAKAEETTSAASAGPAASTTLHDSRNTSGTNSVHLQQEDKEFRTATAAIDGTLRSSTLETAGTTPASLRRNNAPGRLQQAQHASLILITEVEQQRPSERPPRLELQAAKQSAGGSQHAASSAASTQKEPSLRPCRIAAQPHAVILPQREDSGGAPGMGAQQASRANARDAPEARPAFPPLMLTRQGSSPVQQAAPLSPPQAAAWADGGSTRCQAEPPQPVALADAAVMEKFDQPAGATRPEQDVADQTREGNGLCGSAKCSTAGEEGLRPDSHAACQTKEGYLSGHA